MHAAASHRMIIQSAVLLCIGQLLCEAFTSTAPTTHRPQKTCRHNVIDQPIRTIPSLCSSFYDDFEDFELSGNGDDDDDDDDDDEYADMDERSIADFKSKMSNLFDDGKETMGEGMGTVDDLISFATKKEGAVTASSPEDWANPTAEIKPGTVLVANPRKFCDEETFGESEGMFAGLGKTGPAPSLLAKFGLTQPPPRHLGPDRQADLLPVVIVVSTEGGQVQGVLLNRRTGYLLGDLEQPGGEDNSDDMAPILEKFCIQPLWFGGIDSLSVGLDMLHLCPTVKGATKITEDSIYWGGDPTQAQDAMEDPSLDRIYSGFDFKFFVQSTLWSSMGALQSEVDDQIWFPASVSQNILFKSRDRMGTKKAKPLWTEIMGLMGEEYSTVMDSFYSTN